MSEKIALANIYGPQSVTDKDKVWEDLLKIKRDRPDAWIYMGDFNVVRRSGERVNSHFCARSAFVFNRFISEAGLTNHIMGGNKFTFFCSCELKPSKLDQICSNFTSALPK